MTRLLSLDLGLIAWIEEGNLYKKIPPNPVVVHDDEWVTMIGREVQSKVDNLRAPSTSCCMDPPLPLPRKVSPWEGDICFVPVGTKISNSENINKIKNKDEQKSKKKEKKRKRKKRMKGR